MLALHQAVFEWSEEEPRAARTVAWYGPNEIETLLPHEAIRVTIKVVSVPVSKVQNE